MKSYPDSVNQMYELVLAFTEEMNNLIDQIKWKQEKMFDKINALMDAVARDADAAELARQALEGEAPPVADAVPYERPPYWDEKNRTWVDVKPDNGELDLF